MWQTILLGIFFMLCVDTFALTKVALKYINIPRKVYIY